eukprot:UN26654
MMQCAPRVNYNHLKSFENKSCRVVGQISDIKMEKDGSGQAFLLPVGAPSDKKYQSKLKVKKTILRKVPL